MHLIPRLRRDGWQVRALVRDPSRAGVLGRAEVTLATGDVLFHAAAVITPPGGWEAFRRPNVEGTRNAIAAARSASARLVQVSSVAVYGDGRYAANGGPTDESKGRGHIAEDSYYARSKRESED